MSNQHRSFSQDLDLLSEAYSKVSNKDKQNVANLNENVQDGETAYKGGDIDHD